MTSEVGRTEVRGRLRDSTVAHGITREAYVIARAIFISIVARQISRSIEHRFRTVDR